MPRSEDSIALMPAPYGSELYCARLKLRDEVLRQPLGLTLTAEELADDAFRTHFCAVADGAVIGPSRCGRSINRRCSSSRWP